MNPGTDQPSRSTPDVILDEALLLFSERGYSGVSMRDIAKAVGIKAPSIYKHFAGKDALFDALLVQMQAAYMDYMNRSALPDEAGEEAVAYYKTINEDALQQQARGLFLFLLKDERYVLYRRMLTIEQSRDSAASDAYQALLIDAPLAFQTELFTRLIEEGAIARSDPRMTALAFYAPIWLLVARYDHQPEEEQQALDDLAAHIHHFSEMYTKRSSKP